ncbi:MAG: hypothetical protein ACLRMZ_27410 [Blautia marasmi]
MKDGALSGESIWKAHFWMRRKGAHVEGYIRKPDAGFFRELNEYSGNMVKLVTWHRMDGAMDSLMRYIMRCISLGHTAADYDTAAEAMRRGAHHADTSL